MYFLVDSSNSLSTRVSLRAGLKKISETRVVKELVFASDPCSRRVIASTPVSGPARARGGVVLHEAHKATTRRILLEQGFEQMFPEEPQRPEEWVRKKK